MIPLFHRRLSEFPNITKTYLNKDKIPAANVFHQIIPKGRPVYCRVRRPNPKESKK